MRGSEESPTSDIKPRLNVRSDVFGMSFGVDIVVHLRRSGAPLTRLVHGRDFPTRWGSRLSQVSTDRLGRYPVWFPDRPSESRVTFFPVEGVPWCRTNRVSTELQGVEVHMSVRAGVSDGTGRWTLSLHGGRL